MKNIIDTIEKYLENGCRVGKIDGVDDIYGYFISRKNWNKIKVMLLVRKNKNEEFVMYLNRLKDEEVTPENTPFRTQQWRDGVNEQTRRVNDSIDHIIKILESKS